MNSIWFPIALSLVAAIGYIVHSVSSQNQQVDSDSATKEPKKLATWSLGFVFVVLLTIPIGYVTLGNQDKQLHWLSVQQEFSAIKSGQELPDTENAIQDYVLALRTAIDSDVNNGQLWFLLAESYFQLRMVDLADAAITRALRIEMRPDWLVANAQILTARSSDTDITKAIRLLSNAVSIKPDHQSALLTLGFIQLRQQQYEAAIQNWQKLQLLLEKAGNDTSRIQKQIEFAQQQLDQQQEKNQP